MAPPSLGRFGRPRLQRVDEQIRPSRLQVEQQALQVGFGEAQLRGERDPALDAARRDVDCGRRSAVPARRRSRPSTRCCNAAPAWVTVRASNNGAAPGSRPGRRVEPLLARLQRRRLLAEFGDGRLRRRAATSAVSRRRRGRERDEGEDAERGRAPAQVGFMAPPC